MAFPREVLKRSITLAQAVYDVGHGDRVRRVAAFDHLKLSSESGPSKSLVAAASGYGLITGRGTSLHLELTDRGRAVISESNERMRREAAWDVLFDNEIFAAFVSRYHDRPVPQLQVAADALAGTFSLSDTDAKRFVAIVITNLRDFNLLEGEEPRQQVISRETAATKHGDEPLPDVQQDAAEESAAGSSETRSLENESSSVSAPQSPSTENPAQGLGRNIVPQIAFNIQIQLPADATPETYDAIFKNIALHLLGRTDE